MSVNELKNSPLHGLSAEAMLTELVEFYGWAVLDAAIDLKCFRIQPTIPSALTFLKKAEWARNRVEEFYLYCFKGMPKGGAEELELKPRERGFPDGVLPKKPKPLTIKQAQSMAPVAPEPDRAPKPKPKPRPVDPEPEIEEPSESTFKSRFSNSRFRR
ncbi:VF530 family DNA-binding protein [Pontiella sp.]|uniref:VF530 family DNA-binding protein n=1 Tax=Pontiella sp. TaxID=2837462 RepID=UPI003562652B